MSYIEFFGTLAYLWSVWLIGKRNMLTWPVGIFSVLLFMLLFYQIQLYSDTLEQIYYLGASVYGWWYWGKSSKEKKTLIDVNYSSRIAMVIWIFVTLALSISLGFIMERVHIWSPSLFPEAASYPYIDSLTTVMSFVAMWLMARKYVESWIYWIVVDVIGIWLYYAKDVKFIALLYVVLLILACKGFVSWNKTKTSTNVIGLDEAIKEPL